MQTPPFLSASSYMHEHVKPDNEKLRLLKNEVDKQNLTDIWNMILTLDYQVANAYELSFETREEFCGIMQLLLKAFAK